MTRPSFPPLLRTPLQDNPAVSMLNHAHGTLPLASLMEEAMVLAESYLEHPRPLLVIKQNLYHAQRLYERLASMLSEKQCALFPVDESLRVEAIASSPQLAAEKVETLYSLLENPHQVVITSPSGILRHLPDPETFREACMHIKVGDHVSMEKIKQRLRAGGYFQVSHVDQPLCFAWRGGIVDVYSINCDSPVRIEFFDDEVDSIRTFDPDTQKTIAPLSSVTIIPALEVLFSQEEVEEITQKANRILLEQKDVLLDTAVKDDLTLLKEGIREQRLYPYTALLAATSGLWDYMQKPLVIYSNVNAIQDAVKRLHADAVSYIQEMVQEHKLLPRYAIFHEYNRIALSCPHMEADPLAENISDLEPVHLPKEPFHIKLRILLQSGRIILFALSQTEAARLIDECQAENIPLHFPRGNENTLTVGFHLLLYPLAEGIHIPMMNLSIITAKELFDIQRPSGRYERKFHSAQILHSFEDLNPGDYIVHAQHGVGQYVGIETHEVQDSKRDFLRVIYRGNAELLVPLEQFRLVRKFVSREGVVPRLSKLGSGNWEKTRKRLEENVNQIADRLVDLYAARTQHIGHAFAPDSPLQAQFEQAFPYELTPDQEKAVLDVKHDMESDKPMDRLICGDVGFGKTEIAVRAAFKAVSENKQVAMLCPTTILAEQHFHTFLQRFEGYPFTICVLDRFVPAETVRKILADLQAGKVDILIGTHRLLSKDVVFHDAVLLIVDEEQRFGVLQKERIKEMKAGVDVLTLSATPIPRTLQMSLVGIRSMSQLETPPDNRYNVRTYVVEKNQGLIIDAIEKELARDGQVFYLYNNIETIANMARTLQVSIPDAKIGIAHGKMDRDAIEEVMLRFIGHEINVLVCTTIIENGIDIPNANTILIDNAQDFGLAQIYQIKGRVGRSDRTAYAYLLTPARRQLSETAQKRLAAVKEFARLGSGYRIAMRDLTIRGAGDLLGANQSGFIDTVGIDMYMEMLEEAIQRKKGIRKPESKPLAHVQMQTDSYIPKQFAPDDFDKISMYQRIDDIHDLDQLKAYEDEVKDQYGHLPKEVHSLFLKKKLDILVSDPAVDSYKEIQGVGRLTFSSLFSSQVDGVKLFALMNAISKDLCLRYTDNRIRIDIPQQDDRLTLVIAILEQAKGALRTHAH